MKIVIAGVSLLFLGYLAKEQFWPTPEHFSAAKAKERVQHYTRGCANGDSARGFTVSSWPGEFATWLEFSLSAEELKCLEMKGQLKETLQDCDQIDFLVSPPEWFQPNGKGSYLPAVEGIHGFCLWPSMKGGGMYVANRNSTM